MKVICELSSNKGAGSVNLKFGRRSESSRRKTKRSFMNDLCLRVPQVTGNELLEKLLSRSQLFCLPSGGRTSKDRYTDVGVH